MATDLINSTSPHGEPFVSFIPWICKERKIAEPQSAQEREQLFNSLLDMNHIRALGPIVKLMRWYSWFQCERYYSGECWGLKLIMLQGRENCSPNNCCQFVRQRFDQIVSTAFLDPPSWKGRENSNTPAGSSVHHRKVPGRVGR